MGGILSDFWMSRRARRIDRKAEPEFRLWLSYFGFALTIIGLIVFLVCTQEAKTGHWNVTPIIGTAISAVGNQLVTTVMVTYAIDCFPQEAASIGVFVTFVRQIWGFLGPFWYVFSPSNRCMDLCCGIVANYRVGSRLCLRLLASLPVRVSVRR
jgi:MFS family permease